MALVQDEVAHLRERIAQRLRIARNRGMLFVLAGASFVLAAGFGLFAAYVYLEAGLGPGDAALMLGFALFVIGLISLVAALAMGQRGTRGTSVPLELTTRSPLTAKADVKFKVAPAEQIGVTHPDVMQALAIAFAVGLAAGRRARKR
jgi:hypothetical protein